MTAPELNFNPELYPDLWHQTAPPDNFDPDLIDYDAINALITEGASSIFDLNSLNGIQRAQRAASQQTDSFQGQFLGASEVAPSDGLEYQGQANGYDLINNQFQDIGSFYQPASLDQTYSNLPPQYLNMQPIFHFPPAPEAGYVVQDMGHFGAESDSSVAMDVNPIDPTSVSSNNTPKYGQVVDGLDALYPHNFPTYEQSLQLHQHDGTHRSNFVSPSPLHMTISQKSNKRPLESLSDYTPTPPQKHCKFGENTHSSKATRRQDATPARTSQRRNTSRRSPLFVPGLDQPDLMSNQLWQNEQQLLAISHFQHTAFSEDIPPAFGGQLLFTSHAQAQDAAAKREVPHNWTSSKSDVSLPVSDEQRNYYVKMLVHAFLDTSKAIDTKDSDSFRRQWRFLAAANSLSLDEQIEATCWQLVQIAEDLHTRGPISLNVFDETKLKDIKKFQDLTFEARIQELCQLLRVSKNRCGKLLKSEGLHMAVATPTQLATQTHWNKRQNGMRQESLVAGRAAHKRKTPEAFESDDEQSESRSFPTYTPTPVQCVIQPNFSVQDPGQMRGLETFLDMAPPLSQVPYSHGFMQAQDPRAMNMAQLPFPPSYLATAYQPANSFGMMGVDTANQPTKLSLLAAAATTATARAARLASPSARHAARPKLAEKPPGSDAEAQKVVQVEEGGNKCCIGHREKRKLEKSSALNR